MQIFIEILIIIFLLILNGIFAMAEIAIVSSNKSKLQRMAEEGNSGAAIAFKLASMPNRFLSTVQIGITLVGIFAGAFGGATIAEHLAKYLDSIHFIAPYSEILALIPVVTGITYLSLIIGELVPKRVALTNPEKIASLVARPMARLSYMFSTIVTLLTVSVDWILNLLNIKHTQTTSVSEDDIRTLIKEGAKVGILQIEEKNIVERTFKLADKKVNSIMTPRNEIVWLDIDDSTKIIRDKITQSRTTHSYYPICKDSLDNVIGVVRTEDILANYLIEEKINLHKALQEPLFVPETMNSLLVLESFKKTGLHMALVVDEYGVIQGLVWMNDILEDIVGDIPKASKPDDQDIIQREDGSFLVDGLVTIDEFKEYYRMKKFEGEKSGSFYTIGGFMMHKLGKVPSAGEKVTIEHFTIEVIDMDGNRVDKLLVTPVTKLVPH